ncbi:MAG TPA: aminotransferase class I/II-fold pyridoxal phosphate-dependent enzyme [Acidobacteriota bacterium]|nr:aminotransferase class I/II-fold pyridoxal phosphate-dependent enzyme [Acidobacteriota bacterium]
MRNLKKSTLAVHGGECREKLGHAVAEPIVQTATFCFGTSAEVRAYQEQQNKSRFEYGRYGAPTQQALEAKLAALYHAEDCVVTSSGMAAIVDLLLSLLRSGDELVMTSETYRRTRVISERYLTRFGIRAVFAEPTAESVIAAITRRTGAVFLEIPTNPHLYVPDVPAVAAVTSKRGIPLIVDPTIAGPFNADPFDLGADIVILSLTKYIAGHNDVIGGAVLGSRKELMPVREFHGTVGTLLPPLAAYLILRGMKTLALRMQRHNRNALSLARFLDTHPKVRRVYYPALASHPHHEVAARLMHGCGGVVSFRLRADLRRAERFLDRLQLFKIAPSLGGVESLVELVATMSYWDKSRNERKALDIPDDLVRLSAGIEDTDDLIADLEQALAAV